MNRYFFFSGVSSIHAFNNKAAYTSNGKLVIAEPLFLFFCLSNSICQCVCVCVYTTEPLSCSFENKDPWTIPQPEATRWPTNSYSSDADTERDGFEHPQTAQADSSSARSEQSDKSISIGNYWKFEIIVYFLLAIFD